MIPNWPPPTVVVSYRIVCRGNDVYRVEVPRILEDMPDHGGNEPALMGRLDHLDVAIEALGLEENQSWAGYLVTDDEMSAHVTAWRI